DTRIAPSIGPTTAICLTGETRDARGESNAVGRCAAPGHHRETTPKTVNWGERGRGPQPFLLQAERPEGRLPRREPATLVGALPTNCIVGLAAGVTPADCRRPLRAAVRWLRRPRQGCW